MAAILTAAILFSYLHENDIVHGNLSLASIFIQHDGLIKIGSGTCPLSPPSSLLPLLFSPSPPLPSPLFFSSSLPPLPLSSPLLPSLHPMFSSQSLQMLFKNMSSHILRSQSSFICTTLLQNMSLVSHMTICCSSHAITTCHL